MPPPHLQPGNVLLQRLRALVRAAVVDGDADRRRHLCRDASGLQLIQRETTACPDASVIPDSLAADDGPQCARDRARGDLCRLGLAGNTSPVLARRLIEPRLHANPLPVLLEVRIRDDVVALDCTGRGRSGEGSVIGCSLSRWRRRASGEECNVGTHPFLGRRGRSKSTPSTLCDSRRLRQHVVNA